MQTTPIASILISAIFAISWFGCINIVNCVSIDVPSWEHGNYRGIKLKNGLQALLVNDPNSLKSAAVMSVAVGTLNDEREEPGIANLVRYLLFTACKKYPRKHEFLEYVKVRGGSFGAHYLMTKEAEHKHHFSFEVNHDYFQPTLQRFAEYFIDPSFEGVGPQSLREVLKKPKSHDRRMSSDAIRIAQVLKSISQQDHPYNSLTYGTIQMLNEYARLGTEPMDNKLMNFVQKWYSANLMRLVVISRVCHVTNFEKQTRPVSAKLELVIIRRLFIISLRTEKLDAVESMVKSAFQNLRNNRQEKLVFPMDQHPWKMDQLMHKLCIVPVEKDPLRELRLSFPVPDVLKQYQLSPEKYAIKFFNHRGPGTLGFTLPREGLCKPKSVKAEYQTQAGIGFFSIIMELTEEGLREVDFVLDVIFQSIHLLKTEGVQEWMFEEEKRLDGESYRLIDERLNIMRTWASALHDYPIRDIITHTFVRGRWDPEPIRKFLSYLRPDNVNISVVDKSCESATDMRIEPWFKTNYQMEKIQDETIKKWEAPTYSYPVLKMPPRNEFIPDAADAADSSPNAREPAFRNPEVILASSISQMWYKRDDRINVVNVIITVRCPMLLVDPSFGTYEGIFVNMLKSSLEEYEYAAFRTLHSWDIVAEAEGLEIRVVGYYSSKLFILLEKIFSRLTLRSGTVASEVVFEGAKDEIFDFFRRFYPTSSPRDISMYYFAFLLNSGEWYPSQLLQLERMVRYDKMENFQRKLLSRIHIQGFIYGGCDKQKATRIASTIDGFFKPISRRPLPQELLNLLQRPVQLEYGKNVTCRTFSNSSKHLYHAFFAFGSAERSPEDIRLLIISKLLRRMVDEECAKILPPRESGSVACRIDSIKNVSGFAIVVSSKMHPHYVNMRVEQFLERIDDKLRYAPESEFLEARTEFIYNNLGEPRDPEDRFNFYWDEIKQRTYAFQRVRSEFEAIDNIRRTDLITFFKECLAKHATKRRKIVVHVYSTALMQNPPSNVPAEETDLGETQEIYIEDTDDFKNSSGLLPTQLPRGLDKFHS